MIDAGFYRIIYSLIVGIMTFFVAFNYMQKSSPWRPPTGKSSPTALFLAVFFSIFIGLRPLSGKFVDMLNYDRIYSIMSMGMIEMTWDMENKIFDNLMLYLANNQYGVTFFFFIIAGIYFIVTFIALRRLFPDNVLAVYLVWLGSFSTFSYGVNGIKAGAAAAFFLLALSYRDNKKWAVIWTLASIGFHHSMVVCALAYLVAVFYKKPKTYIIIWVCALVLAAMHITAVQYFLAGLTDDKGAMYLNNTDGAEFGGRGGFRYDFVIYSAMPILVGYWALVRKRLQSPTYTMLFNIYTLVNAIWLLAMYASFTNRIAYLSWLMYPVVLVYPYLQLDCGQGQYRAFGQIALGSLAFTLFMTFVYYG